MEALITFTREVHDYALASQTKLCLGVPRDDKVNLIIPPSQVDNAYQLMTTAPRQHLGAPSMIVVHTTGKSRRLDAGDDAPRLPCHVTLGVAGDGFVSVVQVEGEPLIVGVNEGEGHLLETLTALFTSLHAATN